MLKVMVEVVDLVFILPNVRVWLGAVYSIGLWCVGHWLM